MKMINLKIFEQLIEMILFYGGLFILIAIPAFYFYKKSIKTRKIYKCRECGEIYETEHMESCCCKVCGAQVDEI